MVTLGFGFKSYVGYRMKQRRQKEIQKENETYYSLLREVSLQSQVVLCNDPSVSQFTISLYNHGEGLLLVERSYY